MNRFRISVDESAFRISLWIDNNFSQINLDDVKRLQTELAIAVDRLEVLKREEQERNLAHIRKRNG